MGFPCLCSWFLKCFSSVKGKGTFLVPGLAYTYFYVFCGCLGLEAIFLSNWPFFWLMFYPSSLYPKQTLGWSPASQSVWVACLPSSCSQSQLLYLGLLPDRPLYSLGHVFISVCSVWGLESCCLGFFYHTVGRRGEEMSFPLPWEWRLGRRSDSLKYNFVFYFLSVKLLLL